MKKSVILTALATMILWSCAQPLTPDDAARMRDEITAQYWRKDRPEGYYTDRLFAEVLDKCDRLIERDTCLRSLRDDYDLKSRILLSMGRTHEAFAEVENYAARLPEGHPWRTAISGYGCTLRGDMQAATGYYVKAAAECDRNDLDMSDYERLLLKAEMHLRAGDRDNAQRAIDELKAAYPAGEYARLDGLTLDNLGIYCTWLDQYRTAGSINL